MTRTSNNMAARVYVPEGIVLHNRAQRRAAAKANRWRTKPRSQHPRRVTVAPHLYAMEGAATIDPNARVQLTRGVINAADAMRTGTATYRHWQHCTSWLNVLRAVNDIGPVRNMQEYLQTIDAVLGTIYTRASGGTAAVDEHPTYWHCPTLHSAELDAVRLLLELVNIALDAMSLREYEAAYALATARVRTEGGIVEEATIAGGDHA